MTTEQLNLCLAAAAVVLTFLAVVVALNTLSYMRGRDLEIDTRSGWVEIHKAMINLRVQRELVLLQNRVESYGLTSPISPDALITDYTLASAQLRAQLDRLNDDPLIIELAAFLDENKLTSEWQTNEFVAAFDKFVHKVALKSRPK